MTENKAQEISEQARGEWVRTQLQHASKHLAENGVVVNSVDHGKSRYLMPYFAIWHVKSLENKPYWALSGDLPADFIAGDNAKTAREALRHFALSWQIKAENIERANMADETQLKFAGILRNRAEKMHDFSEHDELWKAS